MFIKITNIHKGDAFYKDREEIIGSVYRVSDPSKLCHGALGWFDTGSLEWVSGDNDNKSPKIFYRIQFVYVKRSPATYTLSDG